MEKRSILLIDPEPSRSEADDFEESLKRCLEFMCGLDVGSIVKTGSQYKIYLESTSYDKSSVKDKLVGTDYISKCNIVV